MISNFDSPLTRREALQRAALVLGAALSPSLLDGVLHAQPAAVGATPRFLTAQQHATISALAERILPRTDTPGALDAGVPAFVDRMFGEFMPAEEKERLTRGVVAIDTAAVRAHQKPFARLAAAQQDAVLQAAADAAGDDPKSFFHQLKELTIVGYFTAELVGKNVTHYLPIPGPFRGCVPIAETGNVAWTR
ncbi:MAG: gluconate 2-dehydrogenase subunit 3 family protein [Verrucomicrobia bacterium]|nr:gluconate 2-dehydrogenase subunit 3 family protein [Verrucomicrobiota bacterium]